MKPLKDFDVLWEKFVAPSIDECYAQMNSDFANKCGAQRYKFEYDKYLELFKQLYSRKYKWFCKSYFYYNRNTEIDVYLKTALLSRCLIGLKPITYDTGKADKLYDDMRLNKNISPEECLEWRMNNDYINYKIVYMFSLNVIRCGLSAWCEKKIKEYKNDTHKVSLYEQMNRKLKDTDLVSITLKTPIQSNVNNIITALMYEDILQRDFDYMLYANALFQLQENIKYRLIFEVQKDNKNNKNIFDLL